MGGKTFSWCDYPWRPRLFSGCSDGMEQSATRDSGLLLTADILEGDQVSPFPSVVRLTWRCLFTPSASISIELYNSLAYKLCKVPCNCVMVALQSGHFSSSSSTSLGWGRSETYFNFCDWLSCNICPV